MATIEALEEPATEDVVRLPDLHEVVNGQIVEPPPMSDYAGQVASRLNRALTRYLFGNDIGESATELLFRIPLPEDESRNRRPDLSYVSYERWPRNRPYPFTGNARDVVPDIVTEVVSPGDAADDLIAKAREYLRGGVRLVWLIYPRAQEIHAYFTAAREIKVYFNSDQLEARDILPDFRTPVAELFPATEPPPSSDQTEAAP